MESKVCTRCKTEKDADKDFYMCQGKHRSECKACTIRKNAVYQKRNKPWRDRLIDEQEKRAYMTKYYNANKEKFVEYRRKFKEKNPNYFREYQQKKRNPQSKG